ncbi:hypothetical protein JL722_13738 [Aureococcus anophagefferens]|nr:hypothetical protein JL722_13738 [Aureococcus anophagefferens]
MAAVARGLVKLPSPRECGSCWADDDAVADEREDTRRVALVVRGESFRGIHMMMPKDVKRDAVCLPSSHAIQRAESENHVANLIEPLERAGVKVDVFLATYGCVGTEKFSDVSDAQARAWHADLQAAAPRAAAVLRYAKTQKVAVKELYRSVLVWRFDLLQRVELAGFDHRGHLATDRDSLVTFKDHAWSAPGWFFPCVAAIWARADPPPGGCFESDADGHNGYRCNEYFRAAWGEQLGKAAAVRRDFACDPETKAPYIARRLAAAKAAEAGEPPDGGAGARPSTTGDPDDVDCPRAEVYRTAGGRATPSATTPRRLRRARRCEDGPYKAEVAAALSRHAPHVAHQSVRGRLGTALGEL